MMSFQSVFCIDVMSTEFAAVTSQVLYAHHLPDEHILLTPDLYGKLPSGSYPNPGIDASVAHDFYLRELRGSNTIHKGCRVYAANSYYCNVCQCFPNAYVLDALSIPEGEQKLIQIVTKDENLNQVVEQTTVRVLRTQSNLWKHVRMLSLPIGNLIQSAPYQFNCVLNNILSHEDCCHIQMPYAFEVRMFAVGKHVDLYV